MSAERGRISPLEGVGIVLSAGLLVYGPFMVIRAGDRDAWISILVLVGPMLLVAGLVVLLGKRFPGTSPVGYAQHIVGKPVGVVIGVLYTCWTLSIAATVLGGLAATLSVTILPRTPTIVITGLMVLVCATAVRGGIEVVARGNLLAITAFTVATSLSLSLSAREIDVSQWFPILANGWLPVVRGAYVAAGSFGAQSAAGLIVALPFLSRRRGMYATLAYPATVLGVIATFTILSCIGVFGLGPSDNIPFFLIGLARSINIDFLQNLDAVFVSFWILLNFAKLSVWYYATTISLSDLLGLRDYRGLVWPLGMLIVEVSLLMFPRETDFYDFLFRITPYMLTFEVAIPCLLLLVAVIRGVRGMEQPR